MSPSRPGRRRRVLLVVAGGNFAQFGVRLLLGAVVPLVLVTFDASKSSVGLALTGMWAVYALLQFPSGVLADRYGERPLLAVGLGGSVLGALLVSVSPTLALFGVFVVVLGAGTGLFFSPASALVSRLYERRGGALGALTASGAVAGVVYPAVGSVVGSRFGWRIALGLATVLAFPILLATVTVLPRLSPANPGQDLRGVADLRRARRLLSRPSIAYTTVIAVSVGFTFQAITSFFPTFLVEYRGLTPALAGVGFGGVFGLSSLAQPVAGRLSDRVSRDFAIGSSVTLTALALATLLTVPGTPGLLLGTALLGVGVSWPGTVQARFMDQLSDSERGYGFGLVRTVYMLLGASGSVVVGTLADGQGWMYGYGAVVALLSACLLLLALNRVLDLGL